MLPVPGTKASILHKAINTYSRLPCSWLTSHRSPAYHYWPHEPAGYPAREGQPCQTALRINPLGT